jgi:hypothetical protein
MRFARGQVAGRVRARRLGLAQSASPYGVEQKAARNAKEDCARNSPPSSRVIVARHRAPGTWRASGKRPTITPEDYGGRGYICGIPGSDLKIKNRLLAPRLCRHPLRVRRSNIMPHSRRGVWSVSPGGRLPPCRPTIRPWRGRGAGPGRARSASTTSAWWGRRPSSPRRPRSLCPCTRSS